MEKYRRSPDILYHFYFAASRIRQMNLVCTLNTLSNGPTCVEHFTSVHSDSNVNFCKLFPSLTQLKPSQSDLCACSIRALL